jgi:decaprenylphospho-beta-D-ribofuranose 2-oxidase
MYLHQDLTALVKTEMADAPVIASEADAWSALQNSEGSALVATGMRHSQGGQTAMKNGVALIMETMKEVSGPYEKDGVAWVEAEAGATWSDIHKKICTFGMAPFVQQSSAHFTIGGSIAVDCHGRDVRVGTLAETILWMKVLLANGKTAETRPGEDLFRAVVGGYGACGLVLRARFRLDRNWVMGRRTDPLVNLEKYQDILKSIEAKNFRVFPKSENEHDLHMHFGWVNVFEENKYLAEVLPQHNYWDTFDPVVGSEEHSKGRHRYPHQLKTEGWGASELMRAAWEAAKKDPKFGIDLWEKIANPSTKLLQNACRLDFLREDILFTSSMTNGHRADMLQEYFVPVENFVKFMEALKTEIPYRGQDLHLLSCTVRFVRAPENPEKAPFLTYLRNGKSMVSVAIEANVKVELDPATKENPEDRRNYLPCSEANKAFRAAIAAAIRLDGSFYLPYHQFAETGQIAGAYSDGLVAFLKYASDSEIKPYKKFDNEFLKYLRRAVN